MGKLNTENLRELIGYIKKDRRLVIPPKPGYDSGVHLLGNDYMVVSTDPCIGVPQKWFGWLLVHYAASDVALFGAKPEFCTISLLGPIDTRPQEFIKIMEQACKASDDLGMAIVTGHTGTYEGLSTPVGVCTAYGLIPKEKLVTPGGAKPGDCILCIKPIGLETVVNFTLVHRALAERLFGSIETTELSRLVHMQSCVKEALMLAETGCVHAMHDATEGGLIAALNEMAEASKCGFRIEKNRVLVQREAYILQGFFRLSDKQVLSMSSTGTILVAVSPEARDRTEQILRSNHIETAILGVFTKDQKRIQATNGKETTFPSAVDDPYGRILSGKV